MEDNQQQPQEQQWGPPEHMHAAGSSRGSKNNKKRLFIIAGVVVVLLLAAGGAYVLLGGKKSDSKKTAVTAQTQQTATPVVPAADAATPKTYKSTKLNIEFTHRTDWTMRENSDKSEIILTSPQVSYQKKGGVAAQGVFTLKFRNGIIPEAMKPTIANAVAVKDSEVIAYAEPAAEQRKYTNLSFGGNATDQTFFMVTGSIAFKAGEAFGSNIDTQGAVYIFAGGYGTDPNDALAFDAVPKTSFETDTYKQAKAVIESLKVY
ncbi:MAG: hypothetical protein ABWY71_00975 [Candidatus Saccharimonadales bacterium]